MTSKAYFMEHSRGLAALVLLVSGVQAFDIPDGGMGQPEKHWEVNTSGEILTDKEQFRSAPSALRFKLDPEAKKGSKILTRFPVSKAGQYTFEGHYRSEGAFSKANIGALVFSETWSLLGGWQSLGVIKKGKKDWQKIKGIVKVPEGASTFQILLSAEGAGQIWLDDISLKLLPSGFLPQENMSRYKGDIPKVNNIYGLSTNVLGLEVEEFQRVYGRKLIPYIAQEGDEIRDGKKTKSGVVGTRDLYRKGKKVGMVVGPDKNLHLQVGRNYATGRPLDRSLALKTETWTLSNAKGEKLKPVKVSLKQKPYGSSGMQTRRCWYALSFEKDLVKGESYTLDFGQYDMKQSFDYKPTNMRSEAVQVSHLGFRPDDPSKIGFLSYWAGTEGGIDYPEGLTFSILEQSSKKVVLSGKTKLAMAKDTKGYGFVSRGRNYNFADVYSCDFSSLNTPGEYLLYIEGVGTSFPFVIDRQAWTVAVKNSLRGHFHHRGGQEWKAPWADWDQPRAYHPDDGDIFWEMSKSQIDITMEFGRHETAMDLGKFEGWKTGKKIDNAWGGYYDAGDFDRHSAHMISSRSMFELFELFPEFYKNLNLPIPESENELPDIIDEALYGFSFYRNTQRQDGAIYGGIETNGHPKNGEPAFLDSLTRYIFAPDPRASWRYVATAAQASHVLYSIGQQELSKDLKDSALKAMEWAEKEAKTRQAYFQEFKGWHNALADRSLAAVHLYRITKDQHWHKVFKENCLFLEKPDINVWKKGDQSEAAFVYARLPKDMSEDKIVQNAIKGTLYSAKNVIKYSDNTSHAWSAPNGTGSFPLILSVNAAPWGQPTCRAYTLTGQQKYLSYAVKTSLFSVGANPQNMSFTTKLGHRYPEFPLQVNRTMMNVKEPYSGYTVYGLYDMGPAPWWITKWLITPTNSAPSISEWPINESYWDVESWPMVNENTIYQSMTPSLYVWGYLAGRPKS